MKTYTRSDLEILKASFSRALRAESRDTLRLFSASRLSEKSTSGSQSVAPEAEAIESTQGPLPRQVALASKLPKLRFGDLEPLPENAAKPTFCGCFLFTELDEFSLYSLYELAEELDQALLLIPENGSSNLLNGIATGCGPQLEVLTTDHPVDLLNALLPEVQSDWVIVLLDHQFLRREDVQALKEKKLTHDAYQLPELTFWNDPWHVLQTTGSDHCAWIIRSDEPSASFIPSEGVNIAPGRRGVELDDIHVLSYKFLVNHPSYTAEGDIGQHQETRAERLTSFRGEHPRCLLENGRGLAARLTRAAKPKDGLKIIWSGPIGRPTSFGIVAEDALLTFDKLGCDVYPEPTTLGEISPRMAQLIEKSRRSLESVKSNANSVHLCGELHPKDWSFFTPGMGMKLGYGVTEETAIPLEEVRICNKLMDAVLVPSTFCKRVYERSGVIAPVEVFPHGIDTDLFYYVERPPREVFTFLNIGIAQPRKNTEMLLKAFAEEFGRDPKVRLMCKSGQWGDTDLINEWSSSASVTFLHQTLSDEQLMELYLRADCLVAPSAAEGFCLPILEAMATGLPVVATEWSGHRDFCAPDYCYFIKVSNLENLNAITGGIPRMADVDYEHLRTLMRHVYHCRDEARLKGKKASEVVRSNWTWEEVISKMIRRFEQWLSARPAN